jgi:hypothetical protein
MQPKGSKGLVPRANDDDMTELDEAAAATGGVTGDGRRGGVVVSSAAFAALAAEEVAVEDVFFHNYYSAKASDNTDSNKYAYAGQLNRFTPLRAPLMLCALRIYVETNHPTQC